MFHDLRRYSEEIYNGLGLVDISVEPHYDKRGASDELVRFRWNILFTAFAAMA